MGLSIGGLRWVCDLGVVGGVVDLVCKGPKPFASLLASTRPSCLDIFVMLVNGFLTGVFVSFFGADSFGAFSTIEAITSASFPPSSSGVSNCLNNKSTQSVSTDMRVEVDGSSWLDGIGVVSTRLAVFRFASTVVRTGTVLLHSKLDMRVVEGRVALGRSASLGVDER